MSLSTFNIVPTFARGVLGGRTMRGQYSSCTGMPLQSLSKLPAGTSVCSSQALIEVRVLIILRRLLLPQDTPNNNNNCGWTNLCTMWLKITPKIRKNGTEKRDTLGAPILCAACVVVFRAILT